MISPMAKRHHWVCIRIEIQQSIHLFPQKGAWVRFAKIKRRRVRTLFAIAFCYSHAPWIFAVVCGARRVIGIGMSACNIKGANCKLAARERSPFIAVYRNRIFDSYKLKIGLARRASIPTVRFTSFALPVDACGDGRLGRRRSRQ
jgi:hypothetical protein